MAEGGGLLNRYTVVKPYRGFESLRHRQTPAADNVINLDRNIRFTPIADMHLPLPLQASYSAPRPEHQDVQSTLHVNGLLSGRAYQAQDVLQKRFVTQIFVARYR